MEQIHSLRNSSIKAKQGLVWFIFLCIHTDTAFLCIHPEGVKLSIAKDHHIVLLICQQNHILFSHVSFNFKKPFPALS